MKTNLLFWLLFLTVTVKGQSKYGIQWKCGLRGSTIDFRNNSIHSKKGYFLNSWFDKGNSNICDTNGNLILCSDGYNIYDSNANYIDGGDTLVPKDFYIHEDGWSLYSQSSIFLPMDSNQYYFITPTFSDSQFADCQANSNCYFDLLLFNVIDMNANGGAGKVIKRMQPLLEHAILK
ncbi:MAG: hypothetical protein IPF62_11670 [Bacteroidetes bacterium]|nr:hypothetical protein [Bacteroidota bacterium]